MNGFGFVANFSNGGTEGSYMSADSALGAHSPPFSSLFMPRAFMRERSVEGFMPRSEAAPPSPYILPHAEASALSKFSLSKLFISSSVNIEPAGADSAGPAAFEAGG